MSIDLNNLTPKQRLDVDKIHRSKACGIEHIYDFDEWRVWTGYGYIKSWYDIMFDDNTTVTHAWPNSGVLFVDGEGIRPDGIVKVRLSKNSPL